MTAPAGGASASDIESPYAWLRLATAVLLATIGGVGMWSVVVALPAIPAVTSVLRCVRHTDSRSSTTAPTMAAVRRAFSAVLRDSASKRVPTIM